MKEYKDILVTEEIAKEYLDRNGVNRRISKETYSLAMDMLAGNYQDNGECVKVYEDGTLADGQHRLTAVTIAASIRPGFAVCTTFCFGISKTVSIFDRGRKRSDADSLLLSGMDRHLATALNVSVAKYVLFVETARTNFSHKEVEDFLDEHKEDLLWISSTTKRGSIKDGELNTKCALVNTAFLYALKAGIDADTLIRFEQVLRKGLANGESESAAIVCRNNMLAKAIYVNGGSSRKKGLFQVSKAIDDFAHKIARKRTYADWEKQVFPYITSTNDDNKKATDRSSMAKDKRGA